MHGDIDPKRARAEVARFVGSDRYAIFRLITANGIRADLMETTLEPLLGQYLLDEFSDAQSRMTQLVLSQIEPFSCRMGEGRPDAIGNTAADGLCHVFFRRHTPAETWVFVAHSPGEAELARTEDLMCCLGWLQIVFDDSATRLRPRSEPVVRITQRERECLRWCAEGKTSEEIGIILTLSTHTVNHYLISATKKLNAANRMHAITTAIRLGILDIDSPL